MAKIRHRTFEIFDFLQEAGEALASKSARASTYSLDPDLWRFQTLDTSIRPSGVVHVTFKQHDDSTPHPPGDFGKDLADLAELLTNGSRVLMDFEGVSDFDADVAKLTEFNGKLLNKGSRLVLCNLDTTVCDSFFPHHRKNANS
jgi:hypothetical protein